MKLVYICSPLRGAIEENIKKANRYCEYAAGCDTIPLAVHTIFTAYLQDDIPEQREKGLKMGLALLRRCDESGSAEMKSLRACRERLTWRQNCIFPSFTFWSITWRRG